MNEQRKTVWTESTAKGHITTLRSQSHRCPDRRKVSICMHSSRLPCKRNTKTYITACHYEENYSITESNENPKSTFIMLLAALPQSTVDCVSPARSCTILGGQSGQATPTVSCVLVSCTDCTESPPQGGSGR